MILVIYILTPFTMAQSVYIRFTHIANMQTQILCGLCNAQHPRQRVPVAPENTSNSQTRDLSKQSWHFAIGLTTTTCTFGSNPNLHRQSRLSQPRNGPHSRVATQTQLSFHLPILPPQERYSQKTHSEYQRAIWTSHPLASCQTQIHSTTCSSSLDIITVSKPSGTLDHHPRLRIKYQGEVRTNKDASLQRWGLTLCYALRQLANNTPGAFPNTVFECHRCLNQMVAWETGPTSLSFTGTMVPLSESPATIEEIPASVALQNARTSSPMPHSILQDGFHQARCRS